METKGSSPYPCTVTVRRNPHRKARPTPSSAAPASLLLSSSQLQNISSFPIEDILSMEVPGKQLPEASSENLKVFIRIRASISQQKSLRREKTVAEMKRTKNAWPRNPKYTITLPKKLKKSNEVCVKVNDAHSVTVSPPQSLQDGKRIKSEVYQGFSQVFSSEASQREVYEKMVSPLVEDFLKGKSGMLAALGPSGSGKTHTIFGCGRDPGMVPLSLRQILSQEEGKKMQIFYMSMFEICSEKGKSERIFDLIQDGADLFVQQSSIKGIREAVLHDPQKAESLIACGLMKRATAMTNSNSQSSRSQCIINIRCEYKTVDGKVGDNSNSAVLTIVDLAGAEREKKTGNQGIRLLESNFINNTSMVFGLCLRSLLEHQKNPRKPMQKHFQNSLLTRYLRDYLEGKKRMALLLTVRPGEEDYLDTSFLLRQASPYTKIKFDIIEEHGILNHNKRPVQRSRSFINQGSDACPQQLDEEAAVKGRKVVNLTDVRVQSEEIISIEANERNILRVDHVELEKKEKNHQILQNFGKALWKVLKEYKRKLEVAENEICTLRNCLTSEKTRSAELENQLRDWQSNCCCREGISTEVFSGEVDEVRGKNSFDCEEHHSTDCNEVKSEVYSSHLGESVHRRNEEWLDSTTDQLLERSIGDATGAEDLKNTNEMKAQSTHWNGWSCSFIDQEYERKEESFDFVVSTSQVTFVDRDENNLLEENHAAFDSVLPECTVSSSRSSLSFENNSSFPVGENQTQNRKDKVKSEVYSRHLEGSAHTRNEKWLDSTTAQQLEMSIGDATVVEDLKNPNEMKAEGANWNGEAATLLGGSCSCIDQEYEQEKESYVSTSQATSSDKDENGLLEEDHVLSDSVFPECIISSSNSSPCVASNNFFPVEEDQTQKGEDKVSSVMLLDTLTINSQISSNSHVVRLLPVSSILLKDIGSINFKDENEKPKGVKAEKKRASGENISQGSISLLRLLNDNLAV
ncbi:unnamed protein product [Withania somnifera]